MHRQWVSNSGLKYSNPTFRTQPLYNGVGRYDATSSDPKLYVSAQGAAAQGRPWTGISNDYNAMNITSLGGQNNSRPASSTKRNGRPVSPAPTNYRGESQQQQRFASDRRGRTPTPTSSNQRSAATKKKRPGSAPATRRYGNASGAQALVDLQGALMTAGSPAATNATFAQGGPGPGRQGYGPRLVVKPSTVTQGSPMQPFQYAQTQLRAQQAAHLKTRSKPRSRKPSTSSTTSTRGMNKSRQRQSTTPQKAKRKPRPGNSANRSKKETDKSSVRSSDSARSERHEGAQEEQNRRDNYKAKTAESETKQSNDTPGYHLPATSLRPQSRTSQTVETISKFHHEEARKFSERRDNTFLPETPRHRNTAAASQSEEKKGSTILKADSSNDQTEVKQNRDERSQTNNKRPVLVHRGTEENAQPLPHPSLRSPVAEPVNSDEAQQETTTTTTTVRVVPSKKFNSDNETQTTEKQRETTSVSASMNASDGPKVNEGNQVNGSMVTNSNAASRLNRPPSAHPKSKAQRGPERGSSSKVAAADEGNKIEKVVRVSSKNAKEPDDTNVPKVYSKYDVGNTEDVLIPMGKDGTGVGVRAPGGFTDDEQGEIKTNYDKKQKHNASVSSSDEESSDRQRVHGEIDTNAEDSATAVRQQVRPQTALPGNRQDSDKRLSQRPSSAGPGRRTSYQSYQQNAGTVTSNFSAQDTDPKQQQREREWQQRQRLKEIVALEDFDGHSNTDFYGFGKVLGQGSFGKVRLAWHRLAGCKVAVKSYEKSKMKEPQHWKRVQQEIKLMERLNHPYVIRMLEMIDSPKRIHIIMEYAGGGNLCSYVKSRKKLSEPESRRIFIQILLATEYMHDNNIIHRDVKLENVLFDHARDMKLVDFGFSVEVKDPNKRLKVFCGTPSYMSPEIVQRKEYLGRPVDVWSLGVLLYACLCGHFPFVAKTYPELYKKIAAGHLRFPDHLSNASRDLLRRMLHPDPLKRLTLGRARRHPWAAPVASAALRAVSVIPDHSLLIHEKDPSQDLIEAAIRKCTDMGFRRDVLVQSVLSRAKNAYTSTYYLLLHRYGRNALIEHSERLRGKGRRSDESSPRNQSQIGVLTGQPTRTRSFQRPSSAKHGSNQEQGEYADNNYAQYNRRPYTGPNTQQGRPMSAAPSARRATGGASYLDRILQTQGNNFAADYL